MPSENSIKLREELNAAKFVLLPQIEGLEDFDRLNIKPETKAKVVQTLAAFKTRLERINEAVAALDALDGNDFPATPDISVEQDVYADLKENVDTIAAAFAKFTSDKATTLGVTVGAPELKP